MSGYYDSTNLSPPSLRLFSPYTPPPHFVFTRKCFYKKSLYRTSLHIPLKSTRLPLFSSLYHETLPRHTNIFLICLTYCKTKPSFVIQTVIQFLLQLSFLFPNRIFFLLCTTDCTTLFYMKICSQRIIFQPKTSRQAKSEAEYVLLLLSKVTQKHFWRSASKAAKPASGFCALPGCKTSGGYLLYTDRSGAETLFPQSSRWNICRTAPNIPRCLLGCLPSPISLPAHIPNLPNV